MQAYIPTKEDLKDFIESAVKKSVENQLPSAIHKATRKKWLTTEEVMDFLQVSRRHVQYLRDSEQIPFHQHKRTIRYNVDEIEAFLNKGKVNGGDDNE